MRGADGTERYVCWEVYDYSQGTYQIGTMTLENKLFMQSSVPEVELMTVEKVEEITAEPYRWLVTAAMSQDYARFAVGAAVNRKTANGDWDGSKYVVARCYKKGQRPKSQWHYDLQVVDDSNRAHPNFVYNVMERDLGVDMDRLHLTTAKEAKDEQETKEEEEVEGKEKRMKREKTIDSDAFVSVRARLPGSTEEMDTYWQIDKWQSTDNAYFLRADVCASGWFTKSNVPKDRVHSVPKPTPVPSVQSYMWLRAPLAPRFSEQRRVRIKGDKNPRRAWRVTCIDWKDEKWQYTLLEAGGHQKQMGVLECRLD